jgi:hypothetical protein
VSHLEIKINFLKEDYSKKRRNNPPEKLKPYEGVLSYKIFLIKIEISYK